MPQRDHVRRVGRAEVGVQGDGADGAADAEGKSIECTQALLDPDFESLGKLSGEGGAVSVPVEEG